MEFQICILHHLEYEGLGFSNTTFFSFVWHLGGSNALHLNVFFKFSLIIIEGGL